MNRDRAVASYPTEFFAGSMICEFITFAVRRSKMKLPLWVLRMLAFSRCLAQRGAVRGSGPWFGSVVEAEFGRTWRESGCVVRAEFRLAHYFIKTDLNGV